MWGATYSSLAPASVSTGNRYVFAESATQVITFTTTDESKIYGNTATITDNYTIASSGIAGLENVYNEIVSGGSVSISDVFSVNPTFATTDLSDNPSDGTVVAANVGTYKIIASDGTVNSGYSLSFINSGRLTINRKEITVTAADKTKTYGDANPVLTYAVTEDLTGLASVTGDLATTATTTTNVGDVTITQGTVTNATNANYDITFVNGTLTIEKADLIITADNNSKEYGDTFVFNGDEFTSLGLQNDQTIGSVTLKVGDSSSVPVNTNAGSYVITPSLATGGTFDIGNYDITYTPGTFTVSRKVLTLSATKTYDGTVDLTGYVTIGGLIGTQTLNYSNATAQYSNVSDANNYIKTIDISNGENGGIITNYSLPELNSANASVTINKAILTVKAANESIIFSQSDPLFTAIYSGFKNGENITALSGAASFTRATGTDAGDYNITYNGNLSSSKLYYCVRGKYF